MANKRQKLDSELLRVRNQTSLEKVKEGVKLLNNKHGTSDPVLRLVEAEVEFELYLHEHEPRQCNVAVAQKALTSMKKIFQDLQKAECKSTLFQVSEEASLLLAKVEYAQGNHVAALELYENAGLISTKSDVHMYKKKIYSEAFAIQGLCMELDISKSSSQVDKLNKIVDCYEIATQFLLEYLKDLDKIITSVNMNPEDNVVGFFSETAVFRCVILHIKLGEMWKGIAYLRQIMEAMHLFLPLHMQQMLTCKLAMILLRGTAANDYRIEKKAHNPTNNVSFLEKSKKSEAQCTASDENLLSANNAAAHSKPKFFFGEKKYNPSCVEQEVVLLLLISEIMLNIDPVLDMSPDHSESREETLCNAETLYNLLTVACTYLGQFDLLSMAIEKSLKYAFDRHHMWQQFALSLSLASKECQALPCFSECCHIKSNDLCSALLAAKLCYEYLPPKLDEGLQFAHLAVKLSDECFDNSDGLASRAYLCVGVGLSLKARSCMCNHDRLSYRTGSMGFYAKAHTADPFDHKPLVYLAYELAMLRKLSPAIEKVRQALAIQAEDKFALHLFALLLSAKKQYEEARKVFDEATQMHLDDVGLLATKCQFLMLIGDESEALNTCNELMKQWTAKAEANQANIVDSGVDRMTSDGLSVADASFGADFENGSVIANSLVASRYGPTMSDVTSSLADLQPRLASTSSTLTEAWLHVADVYLILNKINEAEKCLNEAMQMHPLMPSVLYMRGRLLECHGELTEACNMYNNALIIDPFHEKATEHLVRALCAQDKIGFAKKLVQDSLLQDAKSHSMWRYLADILEKEGDVDGAIECLSFAMKLEESFPVLPFSVLIPSM